MRNMRTNNDTNANTTTATRQFAPAPTAVSAAATRVTSEGKKKDNNNNNMPGAWRDSSEAPEATVGPGRRFIQVRQRDGVGTGGVAADTDTETYDKTESAYWQYPRVPPSPSNTERPQVQPHKAQQQTQQQPQPQRRPQQGQRRQYQHQHQQHPQVHGGTRGTRHTAGPDRNTDRAPFQHQHQRSMLPTQQQDNLTRQQAQVPAVPHHQPVLPVQPVPLSRQQDNNINNPRHIHGYRHGERDTNDNKGGTGTAGSAHLLDAKTQQSMRLYRTGMYEAAEAADAAERGDPFVPQVQHLQSMCLNGTGLWERMAGNVLGGQTDKDNETTWEG